jgi:hypothetical protein
MPDVNTWTLDGVIGTLRCGALSACVDLARPDLGVQQTRLNGRVLPGRLLAIEREAENSAWPLVVDDAYVRGDDLVATYHPSDNWPYSPQLYWCAGSLEGVDEFLCALSLMISLETHLLDTWPRICVGSQLASEELLRIDPRSGASQTLQPGDTIHPSTTACCLVKRLADLPISYVEIMPPSDFRQLTIQRDEAGRLRADWRLFADFLEKGVIRRAQLQTAFVPRENDVRLALSCCQAMDRRPLPLTT